VTDFLDLTLDEPADRRPDRATSGLAGQHADVPATDAKQL
jgi:hypothetical protein